MTSIDTPLMQQYQRIKKAHKDAILFFRLGDFYEMFLEDANIASKILNLTLTQRGGVPMCGVPYHVYRSYAEKLIANGKKVAICEQQAQVGQSKKLIDREVVEIITPGTLTDDDMLNPDVNNYILSIYWQEQNASFAWLDVSTAEFTVLFSGKKEPQAVLNHLLERLNPREILINENAVEPSGTLEQRFQEKSIIVNTIPDWHFGSKASYEILCRLLKLINLNAFGLNNTSPELQAVSVLLSYVQENTRHLLEHIQTVRKEETSEYLILDESSQKALDLVRNSNTNDENFTLLQILKHGKTAMGNRLIRTSILTPLCNKEKIDQRLAGVESFFQNNNLLEQCRDILSRVQDLERLSAKVGLRKAQPKDLLAIAKTLLASRKLAELLPKFSFPKEKVWEQLLSLAKQVIQTLTDPLPSDTNTASYIQNGISPELDRLRRAIQNGQSMLDKHLEEEREKTHLPSLRIRNVRQFGYVFEIANKHSKQLPDYFMHRQSISTVTRFSTKELTELDTMLSNADRDERGLEQEIFISLQQGIAEQIPQILILAQQIAHIDMLQSFAWISLRLGFTRPTMREDRQLIIEEGRHPVVEYALPSGEFVPNSIELNVDETTFLLVTGPNMAGKSTYLRQTAIIALLAQIGCYVPAKKAEIGIIDRIFCRVGASDNLARGESTFLKEMNETSFILRNASDRSLVIMDEVGRGTTMLDGVTIAWAVCEFLLNTICCRTIFATHYHELTKLEHKAIKNSSLRVEKTKQSIVFLKQVQDGPATQSYGIDVAQLAGLPLSVVSRARTLLTSFSDTSTQRKEPAAENIEDSSYQQEDIFSSSELLLAELRSLQLDTVTPIDALNLLFRIKKELTEGS